MINDQHKKIIRNTLLIGLWIAVILDILTFYFGKWMAFETNPIFLMTGNSAFLTILVKVAFIGIFSFFFIWLSSENIFKSEKYYQFYKLVGFLLWVAIILLILAHARGIIDNLTISETQPALEFAMQKEQAIHSYFTRIYLPYLGIISAAVVGYLIFKKGPNKNDKS